MEQLIARYPDAEESMYLVASMICQNCTDDLELFAGHKKKYTLEFINGILQRIAAAEEMPNQDQRQSAQSMLRNAVAAAKENCCDLFLYLITFITTDGFRAEDIEALKKEAGEDYYADASNDNWKALRTLNRMVPVFVKKYASALAKADLPDEFVAGFVAKATVFSNALAAFNNYKVTAERLTAAKLTANNEVYDAVQGILTDGKYIFRKDVAKLKEYSYGALSRKVVHKKSGFHITLINSVTEKPVDNAVITFVQSEKTFVSNEIGVMEVELAAGTYSYTITLSGYLPVQGILEVDKNVMHRLNISMTTVTVVVAEDEEVA